MVLLFLFLRFCVSSIVLCHFLFLIIVILFHQPNLHENVSEGQCALINCTLSLMHSRFFSLPFGQSSLPHGLRMEGLAQLAVQPFPALHHPWQWLSSTNQNRMAMRESLFQAQCGESMEIGAATGD